MQANNRSGLSKIPDYVKRELSASTIKKLEKDGMGLSFPYESVVQLRVIRNKRDLGGSFNYETNGGIRKTIEIAMKRSQELRDKNTLIKLIKFDNVHYNEKYDKRRDKIEYLYRVTYRYKVKGKLKIYVKTFSFGYKKPSPDKQLHGFRTAKLFKYHLDNFGLKFNKSMFERWKHERLYISEYRYFDWDNT